MKRARETESKNDHNEANLQGEATDKFSTATEIDVYVCSTIEVALNVN